VDSGIGWSVPGLNGSTIRAKKPLRPGDPKAVTTATRLE
jgi:hypothetical protein